MALPTSEESTTKYVTRVLTRLLALAAVIAAVYVSVGSWLYGYWFFGFFWRGRALEWKYLQGGAEYQLETHPYGIVATALGGLFVAILVNRHRKRLFPILDWLWGWLCTGSAVLIIVTAVLVRHRYKSEYVLGEQMETLTTNFSKMLDIYLSPQIPTLEAPIDFKYLDRNRVDALYSQITPELLEKERSVAIQGDRAAKVGISGGPLTGELKTEKGSQTKSELQRVEFSPERKCVEVINFSLAHERAHYYVDGSTWFLNRALAEAKEKIDKSRQQPVTKESIDKQLRS